MNMHVSPQDPPLNKADPPFLRVAPEPVSGRGRAIGLAATVAIHVAIVAAIIFAGVVAHRVVTPPPIMVSIEREKPVERIPPPKLPLLAPPQVVTVTAPEINIAPETPPQTIQVQVAPKVAPPPAPPAPTMSGETRQSYLARLLSYLNRYKRYPPEARSAHVTGVVLLHFVMDKNGHVTVAEINRSSGKAVLDAEALALMQRADPLPPIPADFGKETIDAIVPIEFSLRG